MSQKSLNGWHLVMGFCRWGIERKWHRLEEEEAWAGTQRSLTAYDVSLSEVTSFKYVGQVLAAEGND